MTYGFNGKRFSEMTADDLLENEKMWQAERDSLDRLRARERRPGVRREKDGRHWWKRVIG